MEKGAVVRLRTSCFKLFLHKAKKDTYLLEAVKIWINTFVLEYSYIQENILKVIHAGAVSSHSFISRF